AAPDQAGALVTPRAGPLAETTDPRHQRRAAVVAGGFRHRGCRAGQRAVPGHGPATGGPCPARQRRAGRSAMAGAAGGCVSAAGSLGGRLRSAAPVSRDGTGYRPAAAVRAAAPSRTAHLLAGSAAPGGPAAATVAHFSRR